MKRKHEFDLEIAFETGVAQKKVRLVTGVLFKKIARALIEGHEVMLDGLGRLKLAKQGGAPPPHTRFGSGEKNDEGTGVRFRVHFRQSEPMKRALKKHLKEKSHGEVRRR